jgi:DNA-binding NarL/FixJ family response regulator
VAVLILSGHVRRELIERAIDAGAAGYVSKTEGAATLVPAIRRAARGEFVLGPDVSDAAGISNG